MNVALNIPHIFFSPLHSLARDNVCKQIGATRARPILCGCIDTPRRDPESFSARLYASGSGCSRDTPVRQRWVSTTLYAYDHAVAVFTSNSLGASMLGVWCLQRTRRAFWRYGGVCRELSPIPVGTFLFDEGRCVDFGAACVSMIVKHGRKRIGPAIGVVIVTKQHSVLDSAVERRRGHFLPSNHVSLLFLRV